MDYLKYDNCNNDGTSSRQRYPVMRDALNASGRPIFFSMCNWGEESSWIWGAAVGNSWRNTGDIDSNYLSMVRILDRQVGLSRYSNIGAWNDPDMLEIGNGQMTHDEYQSHFALWAALKAPLLIGCGLSSMTSQTVAILSNEEVIAVNQDPLGKQADLLINEETPNYYRQVWAGPLSKNRFVYLCFNRHSEDTVFRLDFSILLPTVKVIAIREAIGNSNVAVPRDNVLWSKTVKPHASAMYVVEYRTL